MKNKKIAALFVSGMMMAAALAGCAGSSASSTSSTAAPAGSAPASTRAPSEQPAPQDKPIKIGVAMASVQSIVGASSMLFDGRKLSSRRSVAMPSSSLSTTKWATPLLAAWTEAPPSCS